MLSTLRFNQLFTKSLTPKVFNYFSATESVNANFLQFRKNYDQYLNQFQAKIDEIETKNQQKPEKPKNAGYVHPYNMDHHRLTFSAVKTAEFFHDFVGPEQVSPHYENFLVSRKYLMAFWAAFFVLNFGVATADLNWIAKSSFIPLIFYTSYLYFYIEGRKSMLKPLLVRFYRRAAANECFLFETYYHENIEMKLRDNLRITKNQLEYWNIHKNYQEIKIESLNSLLANSYLNLQQHLANRAVNILKSAQVYETSNHTRFLNKLVQNALDEIDVLLKGNEQQKIKDQILESAIDGLSKGQMTYENEPLLPLILKRIQKDLESISKLTPEEQQKLVQLTTEQLDSIKKSDQQAKSEYISKVPESLDASLKSNEKVKRVLDNWGK